MLHLGGGRWVAASRRFEFLDLEIFLSDDDAFTWKPAGILDLKPVSSAHLLQLSDGDDKVFWPIYREYDVELSAINDERIALIETYAASYDKLAPATATDLVGKALGLEARRTALKQKYYSRLKTALSPRAAAKALGRAFVQHVVDARTESHDLLWHFDTVARLAAAQVEGALQARLSYCGDGCEAEHADALEACEAEQCSERIDPAELDRSSPLER